MSKPIYLYSIDVKATEAALMEADHLRVVTIELNVIIEVPQVVTMVHLALIAAPHITAPLLRTTTLILRLYMYHLAHTLIHLPPEWPALTLIGAVAAPVKSDLNIDVNLISDDHLHRLPTAHEYGFVNCHFSDLRDLCNLRDLCDIASACTSKSWRNCLIAIEFRAFVRCLCATQYFYSCNCRATNFKMIF